MDWKDNVSPLLKNHLERQIAESLKEKPAFDLAKHPGTAQLWVALAYMSKELFDLKLKIEHLEKKIDQTFLKSSLSKKKPKQL